MNTNVDAPKNCLAVAIQHVNAGTPERIQTYKRPCYRDFTLSQQLYIRNWANYLRSIQ